MRFDISESGGAAEPAASSGEPSGARAWVSAPARGSCSFADRIRTAAALNFLSPLQGMTLARYSRVVRRGWRGIGPTFWPRASLLAASGLFNSPFAWYEERSCRRAVEDTVPRPPLFILGHYRSGTTHLQYLLAHNSSFAYPNLFQSFFPHTFLSTERSLAWLVQLGLVRHRFQDHVRLSLRSPMEDEIAICVSTGLSPHMSWALPHHSSFYDRFLTFEDASVEEAERWKAALLRFVKKLTLKHRRMLVLKSPPHTARIRLLLEIFPEARFVHIHRDPHDVFRSTMHMLESIYPYWNLQAPGKHGTEEARIERVLWTYRAMYDAFFEQRHLIPQGHFYELSYEELERDPTGSLRKMYSALKLPGIDQQVVAMQDYLKVSAGYPKNSYMPVNDQMRARVARAWERAFEEWGYPS
jgi:omega-hydroxy-beta-dihydromenaquinone-9 sulfotransferase